MYPQGIFPKTRMSNVIDVPLLSIAGLGKPRIILSLALSTTTTTSISGHVKVNNFLSRVTYFLASFTATSFYDCPMTLPT